VGLVFLIAVFAIALGWSTHYAPVIYLGLLMQLLMVASIGFVRLFSME
jgi:hypothetical protein